MTRPWFRAGVVVFAVLAGALLTAMPLLWPASPFFSLLAWPGWSFSGLCGANDKWGLPNLRLYVLGGTLLWAGLLVFISALAVRLRTRLGSPR